MKFSAINDEISLYEYKQMQLIKQVNYNYLEIRRIEGRYLHEVKRSKIKEFACNLKNSGIGVSAIDTPIGKGKFKRKNYNLFLKYVDIANCLNGQYIRIFSDVNGEKMDDNIREIMEYAQICRYNGKKLLIENEVETSCNDYKLFNEYIKQLKGNVSVLFDVCNFYIEGIDYIAALKELYSYVEYFHVRDYLKDEHKFVLPGTGDIKFNDIVQYLKKQHYKGVISLETHMTKDLSEYVKEVKFCEATEQIRKFFNDEILS